MARPRHLYVFAYDIERDSVRMRVAALLERRLTRVQRSVFEGGLTVEEARALFQSASRLLFPGDSLRAYCIPEEVRDRAMLSGGAPLSETEDFWLV